MEIPNAPKWLVHIQSQLQHLLNEQEKISFRTSGSTGDAKKIWLKKSVLIASAQKTLDFFNISEGDTAALILPAQFIGGAMLLVRSLIGGLHLHLYEPALCPIGVTSVDFISCTPAQFIALCKAQQFTAFQGTILLGGSSLPAGIDSKKLNVFVGYGMTETASHVALRSIYDDHYTAMDGVTFSEREGALVIDAPHLEIYNMITKDEIELIDKTSFRFKGRLDDAINSGGLKIQPLEIEQYFSREGLEVYVSSIPHEEFGEAVVLVTQSRMSKEILEQILKDLPKNKRPKFQLNVQQYPQVSNGKIDRKSIRSLVKESQHLLSRL
jgi:O-succinylbenzoic acid--CoA ligase